MKPSRDEYTIYRLIDYHSRMANHHYDRVQVLQEYLRELRKPGFKLPGQYIVAGTTRSSEHFITTPSDTWKADER